MKPRNTKNLSEKKLKEIRDEGYYRTEKGTDYGPVEEEVDEAYYDKSNRRLEREALDHEKELQAYEDHLMDKEGVPPVPKKQPKGPPELIMVGEEQIAPRAKKPPKIPSNVQILGDEVIKVNKGKPPRMDLDPETLKPIKAKNHGHSVPDVLPPADSMGKVRTGKVPPVLKPRFRRPLPKELSGEIPPIPKKPAKIIKPLSLRSLEDLSEGDVLESLKRGERISLKTPRLRTIGPQKVAEMNMQKVLEGEEKLSRALSEGIRRRHGFHGRTRTPDIIKVLSEEMGIPVLPDYEFRYKDGLHGYADTTAYRLGFNPSNWDRTGRESLIAHELRHLKDFYPIVDGKPTFDFDQALKMDDSIRTSLFGRPQSLVEMVMMERNRKKALNRLSGKGLQSFNQGEGPLLKPRVDALDFYDFLEKGHFKSSFLKENLERIAKGLPLIGTAAGVMMAPTADSFAAEVIPGGVEGAGEGEEQEVKKMIQEARDFQTFNPKRLKPTAPNPIMY
jgi:hypothetical protein